MKREYSTPSAYVELFTPNQYAGNCQPGISEDGLSPVTQQCYFYNSSGNSQAYNLASKASCKAINSQYNGNGSCSHVDASKTVITSKASCALKFETGGDTELTVVQMSLKGGDVQPVYVWSNKQGGYHKMPTSMLKVDNPTDSDGRPYYFNS